MGRAQGEPSRRRGRCRLAVREDKQREARETQAKGAWTHHVNANDGIRSKKNRCLTRTFASDGLGTTKAIGPSKVEALEEHWKEFEERMLQKVEEFEDGPPFTVQRICELLLNPLELYPKFEHFELALERQLNVTSTVCYRTQNKHATSTEKHSHGTPQAFAGYFHQEKEA